MCHNIPNGNSHFISFDFSQYHVTTKISVIFNHIMLSDNYSLNHVLFFRLNTLKHNDYWINIYYRKSKL